MSEYVTLKYEGGEEYVCDTVGKAVKALHGLGLFEDWAILTTLEDGCNFFLYEGCTYRRGYERFVELPFPYYSPDFEGRFEKLLLKIFAPFLRDTPIHRSFVQVRPHPERETGYFVNLFLVFGGDHVRDELSLTLARGEDGHEKAETTVFWLD